MTLGCDCFRCDDHGRQLRNVDDVLADLQRRLNPVTSVETVPLKHALGRILAADIVSTTAVPPFDNSAMDGWAVAFADLSASEQTTLPIGGRIAAGHPLDGAVVPGHAYRIFTGAPLPAGLDTVVMQEDCVADAQSVTLPAHCRKGGNVRRAGESVAIGDIPLKSGIRLLPQHVGVAATLGARDLPVRKPLRVAVFSTGDEICEPGAALSCGHIYDANRYSLIAMLQQEGCAITDLGILPDQPEAITRQLHSASQEHDLIITSGGVSVGDEDHVKAAVLSLGQLHMWRMALKPGKPLALGQIGTAAFLGLPGNPVAVMVTFLLIGRVVIAGLSGAAIRAPQRYMLPAAFALKKKAGRREFPRASIVPTQFGPVIDLHKTDSSGVLTSMSACDGLVDLPESEKIIEPGDLVPFIPFSEFSR